MRITRQTLLKIAEDTVDQRARETRSLLAVYLCGSVNSAEDPFLGDSADIDLVFIHEFDEGPAREIIPLTDDITLDIRHENRRAYRTPRELRGHPWIGPAVYNFKILHDPRHFLDFAQAGLRDQFFRPGNVLARAQTFARQARSTWLSLLSPGNGSPGQAASFLEAAGEAANALVSLEGDPMPERRFLTHLFGRCEAMGQPAWYTDFLELIGAGEMDSEDLRRWLSAWAETYESASADPTTPPPPEWDLLPIRKRYYQGAFAAQLGSDRPADSLWPLLLNWTRAAGLVPPGHPARLPWEEAARQIGLTGEKRQVRLEQLDAYLDRVEETLEAWGKARGADEHF